MRVDEEWLRDWKAVEQFAVSSLEFAQAIPLRGDWEPNDRFAYALGSFRLAKEYLGSILLLFSLDRVSSGNALARPCVESSYRTMWWLRLAKDAQIAKFAKGRDGGLPLFGDLIDQLGMNPSARLQGLFDSLTHGGSKAMLAHFLQGTEQSLSNGIIGLSTSIVLRAATYDLAYVLKCGDLVRALEESIPDFD